MKSGCDASTGRGPDPGAWVDLATCALDATKGDAEISTTWTDPDFDPAAPAFYYARVLENPTCRWSQHTCRELALDCATADPETNVYAACCDDAIPKKLQERAWTSPIWYVPE